MEKFYSFALLVLSAVTICTSCSERAELYGDNEKTAVFDVPTAYPTAAVSFEMSTENFIPPSGVPAFCGR